jgi:hypothetical protein
MGSSFFLTVVTHYTVVSFIQHFPSPSQNVPCIQPIIEKKPGKKLDPRDASSFPNVKNCPTRPEFPELVSIKVATQKPTLPPNKVPGVFGTRADGGRLFRKACKSRNSL